MEKTKKESKSYLDRLTFDPKMMSGFVARYITNIRVVILLLLTIVLLGSIAYVQLPKRLNPEVKIPIVTIITVLPGAGPSDVESLITIPLEDELRSLKGTDTVSSSSLDNVSAITIQFLSSVDGEKAKNEVQSAIDGVTSLPADAQTPKVSLLDFEDQPVWTFALTSSKSFPDLMRTAKALQNRIEGLSTIDRVQTTGFDIQEIVIEISPEKLSEYGISPFELSSLIKKTRASYPAGVVETGRNTFALTIDPAIETIQDIRDLKLSIRGNVVTLSEIASVVERSKVGQKSSYVGTHEEAATQAVTFYVYKTSGTNIDAAGKQLKEAVDVFMEEKGSSYRLITLVNTSDEISKQFLELLGEFRTTILLVMIVLLLFLGLRQALISSLTVPLTFLSAFFFMQMVGMSINFLSLFSFLLALGLLVDDTIVVVSAMTMYYNSKRFNPTETGILVWKDTIIPIWSTTITTIWSFVPLLLTSGIIGEFIKPIPIVVTVTMLSSTAIAVLITLPLMVVLLKPRLPSRVITLSKIVVWLIALAVIVSLTMQSIIFPLVLITYVAMTIVFNRFFGHVRSYVHEKSRARISSIPHIQKVSSFFSRLVSKGLIDVDPFAHWYKTKIFSILSNKSSRRRVIIGVVAYSIFSFALLPLGFVQNEFFPKTNGNQVFVELELPAGTTVDATKKEAIRLLEDIRQTKETEFVTAEIGRGAVNQSGGSSEGNNVVLYSLRLVEKEERALSSSEIAEELRAQFETYTNGKISVTEESGGPPAGSDLQIKLLGEDLGTLNEYADEIANYLSEQPTTTNISKSVKEGTSKVVFIPDSSKLAANALTPDLLGFSLRTLASGFTVDSIAFNEGETDKTDITLRLTNGIASTEDVSALRVTNMQGQSVPLLSLGKLVPKVNPTSISRENFRRTIAISAGVRPGASITEENKKLEDFAKGLSLPAGYDWQTGGVNEENAKSIQSILQAMVLSSVLILITMVLQFGSFRQAVIVLIVIPLAVSSVFLAYALTGTPLSFPAMIGILSLFGIVVTNSMFIVDKINLNRKEGMEFKEAIADAGASRMEPIILTKLCTVFGILPITLADPLWRGLGGAIISGLLIASTIMLLFIPVLYYEWMGTKADKQ